VSYHFHSNCIESQKLSEFSCITFGSLNRGRPPFQPLFLKITNFWLWGGGGTGEGGGSLLSVNPDNAAPGSAPGARCGGRRGKGERLVRNRYELLATPIPLSPRLFLCCVSGGGSIKNSAFSSAVQRLLSSMRREIIVRGQSYFSRLPKYWPPHPPLRRRFCPPPATKAGGSHSPGGEGDGGSIFWKTREIGLPSYNDLSTLLCI
jgi:hypothetical protein